MSQKDGDRNIIPFAFRDEMSDAANNSDQVVRVVADIIAGMTEQGLIKLYRRLTGIDMGSILDYGHGN
jgi:dGTP triphosphohydrolase